MSRPSKWIIAALSLSLMVNVFAAGHFFTREFKPKHGGERIELSRSLPRGALSVMPEGAREAFKATLLASREDIRAIRKETRDARRNVGKAMATDGSLDEAAIAENFAKLRTLTAQQQAGFETALISALRVMTAEERQAFALELGKRGPQKGQKPKRGPDE